MSLVVADTIAIRRINLVAKNMSKLRDMQEYTPPPKSLIAVQIKFPYF